MLYRDSASAKRRVSHMSALAMCPITGMGRMDCGGLSGPVLEDHRTSTQPRKCQYLQGPRHVPTVFEEGFALLSQHCLPIWSPLDGQRHSSE